MTDYSIVPRKIASALKGRRGRQRGEDTKTSGNQNENSATLMVVGEADLKPGSAGSLYWLRLVLNKNSTRKNGNLCPTAMQN